MRFGEVPRRKRARQANLEGRRGWRDARRDQQADTWRVSGRQAIAVGGRK